MILELRAVSVKPPDRKFFGFGTIYFMHRSSVDLPDAHEPHMHYVVTLNDWNGKYLGALRVG